MLLLVAPGRKEKHQIVDEFLSKLNFKRNTVKVVPDLKLANISVGVGVHSSTHPSAVCGWRKGSLTRCTDKDLRTFQGIRKNNQAWLDAGGKKIDVKNFMNCTKQPMNFFPKYGKVIDYLLLPSLHIKMGVVNKLTTEVEAVFPPAKQWGERLHLVREDYHHQYEGKISHTSNLKTCVEV